MFPPILNSIPHSRHEIFVCLGVISFSLFSAWCVKLTYLISFYFIPATISYVLKVHKSPSSHTSLLNYSSTLFVIQKSLCGKNHMKIALAWWFLSRLFSYTEWEMETASWQLPLDIRYLFKSNISKIRFINHLTHRPYTHTDTFLALCFLGGCWQCKHSFHLVTWSRNWWVVLDSFFTRISYSNLSFNSVNSASQIFLKSVNTSPLQFL